MGDEQFIILPRPMVPGVTKYGTYKTIVEDATKNAKRYFGENTDCEGKFQRNNETGFFSHLHRVKDRTSKSDVFFANSIRPESYIHIGINNLGNVWYTGKGELVDGFDRKMTSIRIEYRDDNGNYHTQEAYDKNGNGIVDEDEIKNID